MLNHKNYFKILLIDDNPAIHDDFRKIITKNQNHTTEMQNIKESLFGKKPNLMSLPEVKIDSAYQGTEALSLVKKASAEGAPYALAFVDVRMPPGWDGVETIHKIWEVDSEIQCVICTAHSDYTWQETSQLLQNCDNFLILKKPFEAIEVCQIVSSLTKKWELRKQVTFQIQNLETLVDERTIALKESNNELKKLSLALENSLSITKATLESIQEGIIALSKDEKIIAYNELFLTMWRISEEVIKTKSAWAVFQLLADQLDKPNLFLDMIKSLSKKPQEHVREWTLKNGNVIELFTNSCYIKEKISGSLFSFRDVTERKNLESQLSHQATHDILTGLPNRTLLSDRIQQAIASAKRNGINFALLTLDVDNFKQINDSLGHNAGDSLLQYVAKALSSNIRESDTVARFGGDEFIILLSSQPKEDYIKTKATKFLEFFNQPLVLEGHQLTVTSSIGISYYPKDGTNAETLLKNSDAALYQAKKNGKNNFQDYQEDFNKHMLERAKLTSALSQALKKNELFLHYQPLIQLTTGKILGMEALLRWHNPVLGDISPKDFIPLAEETGLIISIGEWVLKTACLQNKKWQETIDPNLQIAVNVSVYQFQQKNFVDIVRKVLQETELKPQYLELEITESLIIANAADTSQKMEELKKLGVNFSIDDFGTGYASLNYLKIFPFNKVKIDKSFIDGIASNSDDSSIVQAIIAMTKTMNIEVLAEGVEKKEQADFLLANHGTLVQGYYFSPPVDEKAVTDLLKKQRDKK